MSTLNSDNDQIKILLNKPTKLKGLSFITGFRSHIGQTGYIVIRHMIDELNAERIGFVDGTGIPPSVFMEEKQLATPFELYKTGKLVFLFPRLHPGTDGWVKIARSIAKWVVESGFKDAGLIGGLDSRFKITDDDDARFAGTSPMVSTLNKHKWSLLERGLGIYGPLALLLGYFEMQDFPAICILPYAERGRPDPRAASVAVKYLNKIYKLELNTAKLLDHAKEIEKEIAMMIERQRERTQKEKDHPPYYG